MSLDRFDRQILDRLQTDADISLADLGEHVSLSRNAVWRRVTRLEEAGYIRRRVALLDRGALNLGLAVFIAIRTEHHTPDWLRAFQAVVTDFPEIIAVYRMAGEVDYLLHAVVRDMAAYDALYKRLIARIELSDVSSSFVMEEVKQTTRLPLDEA